MKELMKLESPELNSIEKSKAEQIKLTFAPMVTMLEEFEDAFSEVVKQSEEEVTSEVTARAKRVRIDISKVRIETDKLRKEQKDEYLRAGRAIDGVSNIVKWAVIEKENKLKEIENYFEIQEAKRLEQLQNDRAERLAVYVPDSFERDLSKFEEDEFEALFQMKKKEHEDDLKAQEEAEKERIESERKAKLLHERSIEVSRYSEYFDANSSKPLNELSPDEYNGLLYTLKQKEAKAIKQREEQRKENERLRKEIEEREKIARAEKLKREEEEKALKAKFEAEQKAREEKERLARAKQEAELKAEREKTAKAQAELKAKQEAELKAKEAEKIRVQNELNKGDSDKINDLINELKSIQTKYSFKAEKNIKMGQSVNLLLNKVVAYIEERK